MNSQRVIEISREVFEAVLTPSNTYFWVTIVVGVCFVAWGFHFFWGLSPYREDISPFELGHNERHLDLSFRSFVKNLFLKTLTTGPVMGILAVGLSALYFQGKYDAAQASFQEKLRLQNDGVQPMLVRLQEEIDHLDERDARYIERERGVRAELVFAKVLLESHPRGCFIGENVVFFQLVDGYTANGEVIWSKRVVAMQATWKGLVRHDFNLSDICEEGEFSSSEVFPMEKLTEKLTLGKQRVARGVSILNVPVNSMEAVLENKDGRYGLNLCFKKEPFKEGWSDEMRFTAKFPVTVE